jgi:hypothetical protein
VVFTNFLLVLFPLLFAVGWCAVIYTVSLLTGWHQLAGVYARSGEFDGERWNWQSGQMRWGTHYNACLSVGANRHGLYLAVAFPFRVGHPSLFISWSDVSAAPGKMLWFRYLELRFRQAPSIPLRLPERLIPKLAAAAGDAWPGLRNPPEPLAG